MESNVHTLAEPTLLMYVYLYNTYMDDMYENQIKKVNESLKNMLNGNGYIAYFTMETFLKANKINSSI